MSRDTSRAPYVDPLKKDPREEKLPVWAAAMIERLRARVFTETERASEARLRSGPADSDVLLDRYDDQPIRLGRGTIVRFLVGDRSDDWIDVYVDRRSSGRRLSVRGERSLLLRPAVTNVVDVVLDER